MSNKQERLDETEESAKPGPLLKTAFQSLSPTQKLKVAYTHLEQLRQINGGYVASSYDGTEGGDPYDVFWLRDIMYATYANEYIGSYDKMIESYRLIIRIFHKYRHKITNGARKRHYLGSCADEVIHTRVNPVTLEEITNEWGHHQLDIFGLFLYKTGDLIKKGHSVISTDRTETLIMLRDIILYLTTTRWYSDPDFGVWEEGPEVHSSSIGSVLAGFTMWHDDDHYHYKYRNQVQLYSHLPVPQEFIEQGRAALDKILPAESDSRPYDMIQLSLIWPYAIVSDEQAKQILDNIETNLVREYGVIRYPGDLYYNADPSNPVGNEATWPMGLAWLSIIYSKMAQKIMQTGTDAIINPPSDLINKSEEYLRMCEAVMTDDGKVPELYTEEKPNHNVPLAWAQSLYVVARQNTNSARKRLTSK
jgi:phosphorylase kinase alpha/beta subunit